MSGPTSEENAMNDETLANELAALIYERTQMTQGDADDLAWDVLNLVKGGVGG